MQEGVPTTGLYSYKDNLTNSRQDICKKRICNGRLSVLLLLFLIAGVKVTRFFLDPNFMLEMADSGDLEEIVKVLLSILPE